ncbi:MAG: hypothetical protein AB1758_06470 [Candidatus Eremiobacterota bacterium]
MSRRLVPLFLVALVVALYAPFLLGGRVFVPADILEFVYPWKTGHTPRNLETFDVLVYFYPQDLVINQGLKRGELALWNPHLFSGHPLVANGQSALLYPGRLLLHWLLPAAQARTLSLLVHTLLLGLTMFWFLRLRGLSPVPSGVGATAWMLNAFMASWLEFEHVLIIGTWTVVMLIGVELARARPAAWGLVALAGGLSLIGGHIHFCLYTGPLVAAYAILRRRSFPGLLAAGLLSLMLASPALLPFLELQSLSQRPSLVLQDQAASLVSYLPTLICPDFWGNPARGVMLNRCRANLVFPEFACYFGIIPLLLALSALARGQDDLPVSRREVLFWAAVAGLALWAASATPPYRWLAIGFLGKLIPGRVLILLVLAGSVLAAVGAERAQRGWPRELTWLGMGAAVLIATWLTVTALQPAWLVDYAASHIKIPPPDTPRLPERLPLLIRANTLGNPQWWVCLAGALACAVGSRFRLGVGLLLLTGLDLLIFAAVFNPTAAPESLRPPSRVLDTLVARMEPLDRVDKYHAAFYNTLVPYGLQLTSGYESLFPRRYYRAVSLVEPGASLPMRSLAFERFDHPLLDALGLRWLVSIPVGPQPELPGWRQEVASADGILYHNAEALPRAWVVGRVQPCRDLEQSLAFLASPAFVPSMIASVEGPPRAVEPAAAGAPVRVLDYRANRVELEAELPAPGLLVLADQWYPGWEVEVDGEPAPVLPADAVCRGVFLGPGRHQVVFRFRPAPFRRGLWLAGAACLVLLGLLLRGSPLPFQGGRR